MIHVKKAQACYACHRRQVRCVRDEQGSSCKQYTCQKLLCRYASSFDAEDSTDNAASAAGIDKRRSPTIFKERNDGTRSVYYGCSTPAETDHVLDLLSAELMRTCVDYFFDNMYPGQPILGRKDVDSTLSKTYASNMTDCLALSLCASVVVQAELGSRLATEIGMLAPSESGHSLCSHIVRQCRALRKNHDYSCSPREADVTTSFFLSRCFLLLENHGMAWFYLREATTLAQALGMHEEPFYQKYIDAEKRFQLRNLYWLSFATEKSLFLQQLQQHRQYLPQTLHPTIDLPIGEGLPTIQSGAPGFNRLVGLFLPLDGTFVPTLNHTEPKCSDGCFGRLLATLLAAMPTYLNAATQPAFQITIAAQWLRIMLCYAAEYHCILQHRLLTGMTDSRLSMMNARAEDLTIDELTRRETGLAKFSTLVKLFQVVCVITEAKAFVDARDLSPGPQSQDCLQDLVSYVSRARDRCLQHITSTCRVPPDRVFRPTEAAVV